MAAQFLKEHLLFFSTCLVFVWCNDYMLLDYVGCFRYIQQDLHDPKLMQRIDSNHENTNEKCAATCRAKGFKFSGTRSAIECHCGNSYGSYVELLTANCNRKCPGDDQQKCGGDYALSIYSTDLNECKSTPCPDGVICVHNGNGYTCKCPDGLTGFRCETEINECISTPCGSGNMCEEKPVGRGFTCSCQDGYTGIVCETEISSINGSSGTVPNTTIQPLIGLAITGYNGALTEGETLKITPVIIGDRGGKTPKYDWYFIPTNTRNEKWISPSETYMKDQVTLNDSGEYICSVMNLKFPVSGSLFVQVKEAGAGNMAGLSDGKAMRIAVVISATVGSVILTISAVAIVGILIRHKLQMGQYPLVPEFEEDRNDSVREKNVDGNQSNTVHSIHGELSD